MRIKKCKICKGDRSLYICGGCNNRKSLVEYLVNYLQLGLWISLGVVFYFVFANILPLSDTLTLFVAWCYLIVIIGLMIGILIEIVDNFKK